VPGLYVCGWLKRGPTGIIGTNLTDAEETVHSIAQDEGALRWNSPGWPALQQLLQQRGVRAVTWDAWQRLDAHEVAEGQRAGAVRAKCVAVPDMLALALGG
jgi:adrenodoxin-NADP+ reductase